MPQLMPGVIEHLPIETHFEPVGFSSRLATLLATGEFYFGPSSKQSGPDFILERPLDEADRRAGRYCSATGYWTAGHDVVYVGGKPYARKYAPRHDAGALDGQHR
jgi:hypothetical protein